MSGRPPLAVQVREAEAAELEAVGALTVDAYLAGDGLQDASEDGYVVQLRDAAARAAQAQLLVAVAPDLGLVGTVTVCRSDSPWAEVAKDGEAELRMLAVTPAAWGRGVAEALVGDVTHRLRAEGVLRLVLVVLDANDAAHRLYRRLGFRRSPERDWQPYPGLDLRGFVLDL